MTSKIFGRTAIRTLGPVILAGLILLTAPWALAGDEEGGWPGDWLTGYRTARAMGLGGAYVAVADDPIGLVWNPAGLTQLARNQVYAERAELFEGTSITSFGFALPGTRYPTLGLAVLSLKSGDFERTNEFNDSLGSFQEEETAYLLSASYDVAPFLAVGANARIVHQSIEEFSDSGVGFDLGLMANATSDLRFGASLSNLGGPNLTLRDTEETYPRQMRAGAAFDFLNDQAMITAEIVRIEGVDAKFCGGAEYRLIRDLALRLGLNDDSPAGGFTYDLPNDLTLSYGAEDHKLGVMHRFSLSWRFGGFFARSQADPESFSPLGSRSATRFDLNTRTRDEVKNWRLEIADKFGAVVRAFGGKGTPPAHVMWDGKADTGAQLPDGSYSYQLVVSDAGGRQTRGDMRTVSIDTSIPELTIPVQVGRR